MSAKWTAAERAERLETLRRLAGARGEGRATVLEMARLDTPEAHEKAAGADLPLFGGEAA